MEGRSDATSLALTTSPLACPIGEDNTGRANLPPISIRCDVTVPRRTKGEARLLVVGRGIPGNEETNRVLIYATRISRRIRIRRIQIHCKIGSGSDAFFPIVFGGLVEELRKVRATTIGAVDSGSTRSDGRVVTK